jgi:2-polyprenyl-3-methyl-5-hydroxy-6-metoxy-1,4-benzoquinol methylase
MAAKSYHDALWESLPEGLDPPDLRLRVEFVLEQLRAAVAGRSPRVLDVGCGEGQLTAELARAGVRVVGVDVAQEPLRRAHARDPTLDLRVIPVDGRWPLEDASFDVVWAGEVIEHVADTTGWLSQVRRVLAPSGTLLLSTPAHGRLLMLSLALSRRRFARHFDPLADHLRFYSAGTLRRLLQDFGFEQIELRHAGGIWGARRVLLARARRARF